MAAQDEIEAHSNGAHFLRADLHIHSYGPGGSYDVKDTAMTPEGIVNAAIEENLRVIAIADHNAIGNVGAALRHAHGKGLLVVPAIELSTQQGHLLIYFPTLEKLSTFFGKLTISSDNNACHDTMPQCLKYAAEYDGFGILAHVDNEAGLEQAYAKFDAFKQEILNCKNLLGVEITNPTNSLWFSHLDGHPDRKNCATIRRKELGHESDVHIAKVIASDSHAMNAFGRNAAGNKRLTRFKMESLTFDALKIALLDCAARVRLEELIPLSVPHFIGMKLEGGFLKDQVVHFSRNLTCIIGGRGAGKSTLLESLCAASGNSTENALIDSDVWPDCITLVYEDEVGQRHVLTRSKLTDVANADPNGPVWIGIESYGQGQTAETIQHCDKDPRILLTFLDRFIDLATLHAQDEELRTKLLNNQTEIERLQHDRNQIAGIEKAKQLADSQVATLKTQHVREVVELEQRLAQEKVFRTTLQENLSDFLNQVTECLTSENLHTLINEMDGSMLAVGRDQFEAVKKLVISLADEVDKVSEQVETKVKDATQKVTEQLNIWIQKEKDTRDKIENLRRDLEKQKIPLDMAFIRKVTKDAIDYAAKLELLKKSIPKQAEAFKLRHQLMSDRRTLRSRVFTTRQAFATVINNNLATCVVDYSVHLKFHEGTLSTELEDIIKEAMGWRTAAVPKAALIASTHSPLVLMDAIEKKNTATIEAIVDKDGNKVFSGTDAKQILTAIGEWNVRCRVERCPFEDRPEVRVTREIRLANGKVGVHSRDFAQLSLGQQQAILLTVLLFSKSKVPLVIDQPEDNLDGEFIYTTLVRSLRSVKEQRQVIIVTHNANIAVLGDAELIIPLRGAAEYSTIRDRGSIDTTSTKDLVCTILEGSPKAFIRRKEMYGY